MARYNYALATAQDDAQLQSILSENAMPGHISISFHKSPSYFQASKIQGSCEVVKCIDLRNKKIIGFGSRFTHKAFVNGDIQEIAYLGDLRLMQSYRQSTLLARGYQFFRQLHEKKPVAFYTTMIWEGNQQAEKALIGARANLPEYRPMGKIHTPAIHLDFPKNKITYNGLRFEKGTQSNLSQIFGFIQECYSKKQFAPVYSVEDMSNGRLQGLKPSDFYLAIKGNSLVGVIAAWDISQIRQVKIEKYSTRLKLIKPTYNCLSKITALKPLLNEGQKISYFNISLIAIKDNDCDIFRALLRQVYCDRRTGDWQYFICGLHENDPLSQVLKEYRSLKAGGNLYCVSYSDTKTILDTMNRNIPYVEAATL